MNSERVALSDEERDELACVATGHEPDHCDCNDAYRDDGDRFCEYAHETFTAVEHIIAAREKALREEIADLRSRLGCINEATNWDRPYDTRLNAIRGLCDLSTDGMTPVARIARGQS